MKIAIVEDNLIFRKELTKILSIFPGLEVIGVFDQGEELLSQFHRLNPDILFLDIGLPGISGIQVADRIRQDYPYMELIFITADENYIRDAFDLYASDYINKPLNVDRLHRTLTRIQNKFPLSELRIELRGIDRLEILDQTDIYTVEALSKRTVVYTQKSSFICLSSLKEMEELLDKEIFIRTSRSNLVNLKLVESISPSTRTSYQISFKSKDYKAYLQKDLYYEFRRRIKGLNIEKDGEA